MSQLNFTNLHCQYLLLLVNLVMNNELSQYYGVDIFSFAKRFPGEVQCKAYLSQYKWRNGFTCSKCGHQKEWKGPDQFTKVCAGCRHVESCTANTLFHKVKFGLVKAFMIVHEMASSTKNQSCRVMGRKYDIDKDTAWLFMQKVRDGMGSATVPLQGKVECAVSSNIPRQKSSKQKGKIKIMAGVQCLGNGIVKQFAEVQTKGRKLAEIMKERLHSEAIVYSNHLSIRQLIQEEQEKEQEDKPSLKRIERFTSGLQSWIKGIHHAISRKYSQRYLDEYCFRLNHHRIKPQLFDLTIQLMVDHPPWFYRKI